MKILGIDPGYDKLGIAIIENEKLIHSECFRTSNKETIHERLKNVGQQIGKAIKKYSPDCLAIETLFITKNQKTAMRVSEARGIIIYEALLANLDVFEYSPLEIKMAITGYGKSDKNQMMKMVPMLIKTEGMDKKGLKNIEDDEFDAIAVALTCLASRPKNHTKNT